MANDKRVSEIVYVADKVSSERKAMGWEDSYSDCGDFYILSSLSNDDIEEIFKKRPEDSIHLFSGLNSYPNVHRAFKISLKYNVSRAIICERPMTYAFGYDWVKPLWLHKLRFKLRNWNTYKSISYVFEIGEDSSHYYKSLYNGWKVFPFAYCTRSNNEVRHNRNESCLNVAYVGSLSKRKSVISLLKVAKHLKDKGFENKICFNIVGCGKEESVLRKYMLDNALNNINFCGVKKNAEIPSFLVEQDVFVLPSIHDGWGAVINEALLAGLFVICSDRCGAKELLYSPERGAVYKLGDIKKLEAILLDTLTRVHEIRNNVDVRRRWADLNLNGYVIGKYMIDCLAGLNPNVPWR